MITVISKKINDLDIKSENIQTSYDYFVNHEVHFDELTCSCGNHHCLTKHAYYKRTIKNKFGSFKIKMLRVKCSVCHRTHAVMMTCIVPYSQILLKQHIDIVSLPSSKLEDLMIRYTMEDSHIRYIKKQFQTHWKLLLYNLDIDESIALHCFLRFKKQFMQIRNTVNIHFLASG